MKAKQFKEKLSEVAEDLFSLEVNTLIVDRISAVKMPDPRHALIDIAKAYQYRMQVFGVVVSLSDKELGSHAGFSKLRQAAHTWMEEFKDRCRLGAQTEGDLQQVYLFDRVNTKCAQIGAMMKRLESRGVADWDNAMGRDGVVNTSSIDLDPKDALLIRKTWELGTAQIAIQTVVQLDGDVVTRISPQYAQTGWQGLHRIHHKGSRVTNTQDHMVAGLSRNTQPDVPQQPVTKTAGAAT